MERMMSYQPNVINKGDYVEINGVTFIAKKDFNRLRDTKLVLIPVEDVKPRYYVANKGMDRFPEFKQKEREKLIELAQGMGLTHEKRDE